MVGFHTSGWIYDQWSEIKMGFYRLFWECQMPWKFFLDVSVPSGLHKNILKSFLKILKFIPYRPYLVAKPLWVSKPAIQPASQPASVQKLMYEARSYIQYLILPLSPSYLTDAKSKFYKICRTIFFLQIFRKICSVFRHFFFFEHAIKKKPWKISFSQPVYDANYVNTMWIAW